MSKMFHGEQSGEALIVSGVEGAYEPATKALVVRLTLTNGQVLSMSKRVGYPDAYFLTGRGGNSVAITRIQAEELVPGISKSADGGA